MSYCQCCYERYSVSYLRKVTEETAHFMRQFVKYRNLSKDDDICVNCIEKRVKTDAQQLDGTIVFDATYVMLDNELKKQSNNSASRSHNGSTDETTHIYIRLQYLTSDTQYGKMLNAYFTLDTTVGVIIKYLIDAFQLKRSCEEIVLTKIKNDRKLIGNIDYTLTTTLRQLHINQNTYLYFEDRMVENVRHEDTSRQISTNVPSLNIRVYYSINHKSCDYKLPYDTTIEYFVSAVIESFGLDKYDRSCINLTRENSGLNINKCPDQKLTDLGVGDEYQLLFLSIERVASSSSESNAAMPNQISKVYMKRYIRVHSPFLRESLQIDLLTIGTLLHIKQKIIDQYRKERQIRLQPNDIRVQLNGIDFSQSDENRLISELKIGNNTELFAYEPVRTNEPLPHSNTICENQGRQRTSHVIVLQPEWNNYPVLKRSYPVGLYNLGNTCFLNSALQCLSHVTPLTLFFLHELPRLHKNNQQKYNRMDIFGNVTHAYWEFIWHMWNDERTTFSPNGIHDAIGSLAPQFTTYRQQDAQEFLVFLLNTLHNELQHYLKTDHTIITKLFFNTIESKTVCSKCQANPKITSNIMCFIPVSLVQNKRSFRIHFLPSEGDMTDYDIAVFPRGSIRDLVQTFVEEKRLRYRRLRVLSSNKDGKEYEMKRLLCEISENEITIVDEGDDYYHQDYSTLTCLVDKLTLYECINHFVTPETIQKFWSCKERCDGKYAIKQMQLNSLAHVLIVQLKRFTDENGSIQKVNTYVDFPINGLDVNQFDSSPSHRHANMTYDLIAVSNHMGSVDGGHYTTYARQSVDEPWYLFNDSQVTRLNNQDPIVSRNAYTLVYLRREQNQNECEV